MERVHSMFSNAFNTPAGQLVEKATASTLNEEEWNLNMEVCDAVNSYPEGAKDAVKAIKKRLSNNKHFNQISLTLSVLETCVKNCGGQFHILICTKDFCNESLLKVIQAKNNPPPVLRQRVLGLIKQYAEAFGSNPLMSGVYVVYKELKSKGYEFPKTTSLKGMLKRVPQSQGRERSKKTNDAGNHGDHHSSSSGSHRPAASPSGPIKPTAEQQTKLRKDIGIVNGNVQVFSEMLTELNPLNCDPTEYELLQELHRTCRAMQQRIVELIGQVANEGITVELLQVNDDLNNVFLRYERFEKYKSTKNATDSHKTAPAMNKLYSHVSAGHSTAASFAPQSSPVEPPPSYSDTEQPTPVVSDLIDFGDDTSSSSTNAQQSNEQLSNQLTNLGLSAPTVSAPTPPSHATLSEQLAAFDDTPKEVLDLGSSEAEIEKWLSLNGSSLDVPAASSQVDNERDEFSDFLNQRATVTSQAPDKL